MIAPVARGALPDAPAIVAWFGTARNAARVLTTVRYRRDEPWPSSYRLAGALLSTNPHERPDRAVGIVEAAVVARVWARYRGAVLLPDVAPDGAALDGLRPPRIHVNGTDRAVIPPMIVRWLTATFGTRRNITTRLGIVDPARRTRKLPRHVTAAIAGQPVDPAIVTFILYRIAEFTAAFCVARQPWEQARRAGIFTSLLETS